MADSKRETLLANIETRLAAIMGDSSYSLGETLAKVERYRREWDGEEDLRNTLGELPCIVIRELNESCAIDTLDQWSNTLAIDLQVWMDLDAGSEARTEAIADVKRALFAPDGTTGAWDGFGVGAHSPSLEIAAVDVESGLTLPAVHVQVTCTYQDQFGDPTLGG